ncbi:MAG: hypothetical protein LBQ50_08385, partial [Planctomycetaceae bacterium]|nr:hypothetical protein [Planctomycetaceae bacterium]
VRRLNKITDIDALIKVTNYLSELNLPEDVYILTPEEEQMIDDSETEPCISDEEARRRTRECLNKLAKNFV